MKIDICIATKDRHSELALLLQSLRTQSFQNFDIFILDDKSGTSINQCYFLGYLFNRLRLENHRVKLIRNEIPKGVCGARNMLIEETNKVGSGELILRLDDDVILKPDYIEKLLKGIEKGYDAISGVVPALVNPEMIREVKYVTPIINYHELDSEGNIIINKDECAYCYDEEKILLTPHFRTNLLYKKEIQQKINYPCHLSFVGFREEGFFSFKMILQNYKIGINTAAKSFHFCCPSGGCRSQTYQQDVMSDDKLFRDWVKEKFKEKGDFLRSYYEKSKL